MGSCTKLEVVKSEVNGLPFQVGKAREFRAQITPETTEGCDVY